jgi:hypothetical protein
MKDYLKPLVFKLYDSGFNCIHLNSKNNYLEILANFSKNKYIYFFKYVESYKKDKKIYSAALIRNNKTILNVNSDSFDKVQAIILNSIVNL